MVARPSRGERKEGVWGAAGVCWERVARPLRLRRGGRCSFWVAESEPVVGQTGQGRGVGGLSAASAFSSESPSEDCEGCPLSFSKHLPQSSLKSAGPS